MNLPRVVQALVDAQVDFVLVGGWSAILHGSNYVTRDLDICFSREPDNLKRLAAALSPFHPRLRDLPSGLPFVWDEGMLRNATILTLATDAGVVDLLAEIAGVGVYPEALANSVVAHFFEREVRILDLAALIRSKRAAGRPLPELEALLEASKQP